MQVTWEAVTATATLVSSLAVLAAVIIAIRQVRVGNAQVDALRRATQLDGTMKIFALLTTPEQREARRFVVEDLERRFREDEAYREQLLHLSDQAHAHPELSVMRLMEMTGIYIKHGLLEADIVFDYWVPNISIAWRLLQSLGVIEANRRFVHPAMWVNFEDLITRYEQWEAAQGLPAAPRHRPPAQAEVVADASSP